MDNPSNTKTIEDFKDFYGREVSLHTDVEDIIESEAIQKTIIKYIPDFARYLEKFTSCTVERLLEFGVSRKVINHIVKALSKYDLCLDMSDEDRSNWVNKMELIPGWKGWGTTE